MQGGEELMAIFYNLLQGQARDQLATVLALGDLMCGSHFVRSHLIVHSGTIPKVSLSARMKLK